MEKLNKLAVEKEIWDDGFQKMAVIQTPEEEEAADMLFFDESNWTFCGEQLDEDEGRRCSRSRWGFGTLKIK